MWLASQLMPFKTGCMALMAMFCIWVHTSAQVMGSCAKAALVSSTAPRMALTTTPEVTFPWEASSRISPVVTPMYSAMVWAIMGVCSSTEFNSSPRSTPDESPWVSWSMAAWASVPEAPESRICFWSCSAKATICSAPPVKAFPARVPSLATVLAMSV